MIYQEIEGDLIELALAGSFDVIAHGCNCFCTMKAGIAPQIAEVFGCDRFNKESLQYKGDINKLGTIDFEYFAKLADYEYHSVHEIDHEFKENHLVVVNCYIQFMYGKNHTDGVSKPLDYEALTLCLRKINHIFKGKHIGMPRIGCGLAGGVWDLDAYSLKESESLRIATQLRSNGFKDVKTIIQEELKDCKVTIVKFKLK